MSAHAESARGGRALVIRGRPYPILLPKLRDPRLHLAAVIISLQILGQVAFDFKLSIAQILVALFTCAVIEVGIAFRKQHVILWPASALLTGNGVAFILRVPGTVHGDWWSMNGWWIYAGTAAVSLLSKYVIKFRGRHIFNPSNFGLVLCFLILGKGRAFPLEFWWGPMSPWMALALAIIVAGGLAILLRVHLIGIAIGFWVTFAVAIGVISLAGHEMTASYHLGPITGAYFWWVLITSPEVLVFTFFMITDPKTIPNGAAARRVYAVGIGLLSVLLMSRQTTEFATKVALLGSLTLVCAARPLLEWAVPDGRASAWFARTVSRGRARVAGLGVAGVAVAAAFAGLLVLVGLPARPSAASTAQLVGPGQLPPVTILHSPGVSSQLDERTALLIAGDLIADLRTRSDALRLRDAAHASAVVSGAVLADVRSQIQSAQGREIVVPSYRIDRMSIKLKAGVSQAPATILATVAGIEQPAVYSGSPPTLQRQEDPVPFTGTFELGQGGPGYVILNAPGVTVAGDQPAGLDPRRHRQARRRAAAQRGAAGRAELPPGLVPLRHVERRRRDDGRRPLLARLQQRRLAGPLRRQLVLRQRHREVGRARRPSAKRAVREREREVRRREPRLARRPRREGRRLRGGGLQRRRPHGSPRHHHRPASSSSGTTATGRSPRGPAPPA